ncbi:hypothetical protein ABFG93_22030 (plasmid) [Pseudalkalibacillus hwajinpoensis]|uniref:hypothetical protein n=1 Tax=Guptibacillus hwajinpoensis TaxID=208199 RepID=UPI00325B3880
MNESRMFQPDTLAEIYTAMEFSTEVVITYKLKEKIISIHGSIHYLDFSSHQIRVINHLHVVHHIPIDMVESIRPIE